MNFLAWGARGSRFESYHPYYFIINELCSNPTPQKPLVFLSGGGWVVNSITDLEDQYLE